mgnify:CR=1 FL=1
MPVGPSVRCAIVVISSTLLPGGRGPETASVLGRRHDLAMRLALVALLVVPLLAGCGSSGEKTVKPDGAERSIENVVGKQTGFRPTDVKCPSGVEAKVGVTFDCHFTGPEPRPYVAHMRITKVDGASVRFQIDTLPER